MATTDEKKKAVVVRNRSAGGKHMIMVAPYRRGRERRGIYADANEQFLDTLVSRIHNDQQNVIAVTGDTGSGKSTYAIQLCYALSKRLHAGFDLAKDYVYSLNDLWIKLGNPYACPISLFDEGAVTLASTNAMKREDRDMVTLFNTMRSRGWTTVIAIPSISHLNKAVRGTHVDFLCICSSPNRPLVRGYDGRGFVQIHEARRGTYSRSSDPYWKLIYTGVFGDLPPDIKEMYLPIKSRKQDELVADIIKRAQEADAPKPKRKRKGQPEETEESECNA